MLNAFVLFMSLFWASIFIQRYAWERVSERENHSDRAGFYAYTRICLALDTHYIFIQYFLMVFHLLTAFDYSISFMQRKISTTATATATAATSLSIYIYIYELINIHNTDNQLSEWFYFFFYCNLADKAIQDRFPFRWLL